jgi:hypothetical protein
MIVLDPVAKAKISQRHTEIVLISAITDTNTGATLLGKHATQKERLLKWHYCQVLNKVGATVAAKVVDGKFTEEIDVEYLGLSGQTIKSVIAHLSTWYTLTMSDQTEALAQFNTQWVKNKDELQRLRQPAHPSPERGGRHQSHNHISV